MLNGADVFVLSTGTVCTVEWTRPENGSEVTQEEQKKFIENFSETWFRIVIKECERLLETGNTELAEKRWNDTGLEISPPWQRK